MKTNILFIINPISGGKDKADFPVLVLQHLDESKFNISCLFTTRSGEAFDMATAGVRDNEIVVAVGGDGTINEVASAVEGSGRAMGIIPYGSGNGLARSLGIPLNIKSALGVIKNLHVSLIDSGSVNDKKFFNMAGIGFDAHISAIFAQGTKRGLGGYVKTTMAEISNYQPQHYKLDIDGKIYDRNAFMISIANSSQFGNNAHISPFASIKDGLLDVCIIKPFPFYQFPVLSYRMFSKSTHRSRYVEIIRGKEIRILRCAVDAVHLDGEPFWMSAELNIEVKPLSLAVLT